MLEFASLLLGLVWGYQPIEMVVGDPNIVRVELRLDGRRQVVLEGAPWKTAIDFGQLAPHRLEVLGFSADGKRLARAEQWINVPRPAAEARLIVEQDAAGRKTHAVLKWESVLGEPPVSKSVSFDGVALPAGDGERFAIPPADPAQLHFLTAELIFPDGSTAHAEASFGGQFGDEVQTELTAFPVRAAQEDAPLASLYDCMKSADGQPLRVAQVEKGAAEVLFVRDAGAEPLIRRLRENAATTSMPTLRGTRNRLARSGENLRYDMSLEDADRVRFVWPNMLEAAHPHFEKAAFFESSPFVTAKDGGLFFFLTRLYPDKKKGNQHLADALALAGLRAAAEGRRRAAVLVAGDLRPEDHSAQTPADTRAFLDALQVPLHLWAGASQTKEAKAWAQAWPASRPIGSPELVRQAVVALLEDLDSQRIVWVAGRYLASEIHLDAALCPGFLPLFPASPPAAGAQGM